MINRRVYIINGWKVTGRENIRQLENELYDINEDYTDDLDGFYIYDNMCGEYIYFGAILDRLDLDKDFGDVIINEKLLFDAAEKYKKFLNENPKYAEVFQKYINNEQPQVMVVLRVW